MLFNDINSDLLGGSVSKYIMDRKDMLNKYLINLEHSLDSTEKSSEEFMRLLVKGTGIDYINSLCIYNFLLILSQQDTKDFDDDSEFSDHIGHNLSLVSVAVKIGKSIVRKYLSNTLKNEFVGKDRPKYSVGIAG